MFEIGDLVEVVDVSPHRRDLHVPPLSKGERFVVLNIHPVGFINGGWRADEMHIQIGREDTSWQTYVTRINASPPATYDSWNASRFRKIEKKRERETLYVLLGIDSLLTKTREPADAA